MSQDNNEKQSSKEQQKSENQEAFKTVMSLAMAIKEKQKNQDVPSEIELPEAINKQIMPGTKTTIGEWLPEQPKKYHPIIKEAIIECIIHHWELHEMNISSTAREIGAKRNPKGW